MSSAGAYRRGRSLTACSSACRTCRKDATRSSSMRLAAACGPSLLDLHADPDHHRSVFTLAGPGAARRRAGGAPARSRRGRARRPHARTPACTRASARSTSCRSSPSTARGTPRRRGRRRATRSRPGRPTSSAVPVFLYGDADPQRRSLPDAPPRCVHRARARPRARRAAPAAGRDRGRRAPGAGGGELLARPRRPRARRAHRAVGARARRRTAGCARARVPARVGSAGAGVDEPRRPRGDRAAARVRDRARSLARAHGADVARVELVGLVPAPSWRVRRRVPRLERYRARADDRGAAPRAWARRSAVELELLDLGAVAALVEAPAGVVEVGAVAPDGVAVDGLATTSPGRRASPKPV